MELSPTDFVQMHQNTFENFLSCPQTAIIQRLSETRIFVLARKLLRIYSSYTRSEMYFYFCQQESAKHLGRNLN